MRISTARENRYDNGRNNTNSQKSSYHDYRNNNGRITSRSENVKISTPHKAFNAI